MIFCKYRDIFGEPRKGAHSYRVFDVAIVDAVATIVLAVIIALLFPPLTIKNVSFILILLLIIGTLMHYLFCVQSKVLTILGIQIKN